jgi:hypothetical protein
MMREACERDEFRTPVSPEGIRFVQVTNDPRRDSTVAAQYIIRWTPDSKRFFFYRAASADGAAKAGIWACDTEDNFAIWPVYEWDSTLHSHTVHPAAASGKIADTFVVCADGSGIMVMCREGGELQLCHAPINPGKPTVRQSVPAPLATGWLMDGSADGQRVVFHVFLGDGQTEGAPWGARIFDLPSGRSWVVELDNKTHKGVGYRHGAAYLPDQPPAGHHDLVTHLSPSPTLADGSWRTPPDGRYRHPMPPDDERLGHGYTLLFRDDGSDYPRHASDPCRILPLPRRPGHITSHAGWRGARAESWVASMYNATPERWRAPFIEAWPCTLSPEDRRADRNPPDGRWVDLTRMLARADACHFDFDASGRHFVSDTDGYVLPQTCMLYVGTYQQPGFGEAPYFKTRLLGIPRTSWKGQPAHPHPFLSPDGKYAVFQSDFSGRPQVHVACDFAFP